MKILIKRLKSYYFLLKNNVKQEAGVYVDRPENIQIGSNVSIKYRTRIRSRNKKAKIIIGNSVKIREFTEINAKGDLIVIKDYCFLAKNCWIGGAGCIRIGTNSMLGIGCILVASDHDYHNIKIPYYEHSEVPKDITIGNNVWVGSGVVVLGGSNIGSGSVVSAGAVVKGKYPENSLIAGIPAIIKSTIKRNDDNII